MPSLTLCAGPPGTMLLSHASLCLHRAGRPEPGRIRDIMVFSFRHSRKMDLTSLKRTKGKSPPL
mgnify:CR=1 FL=1